MPSLIDLSHLYYIHIEEKNNDEQTTESHIKKIFGRIIYK